MWNKELDIERGVSACGFIVIGVRPVWFYCDMCECGGFYYERWECIVRKKGFLWVDLK